MCAPTKQNAGFWLKSLNPPLRFYTFCYMDRPNSYFFPIGCSQISQTMTWHGHQFVWLYPWRGHLQNDQHFSSQICMTVPTARSFATRPAFSVTNLYDCTHGEKFLIARYSSPFWFFFWFLHPLICTILTDLQKHPFLSTKSVGLCKSPNFHRWEQVSA